MGSLVPAATSQRESVPLARNLRGTVGRVEATSSVAEAQA